MPTNYLNQFHYQLYGSSSAPKMVFLHGLMGFGANWRRIVPSFEEHFQILTYDQRGHGRSFKPKTGYAPEDYANDLHKILEELHWDKITLIGHSMGGRNAMNFAARFPHQISSLIIEDIGPESEPNDALRFRNMLGKVPTPFPNKKTAKEFFLNDFFEPKVGNYLYSNLVENEEGLIDWRFSKEAIFESVEKSRSQDRWTDFLSIKAPTLVIRGGDSQDLPEAVFERMLKENPLVRGITIPHTGHWVHFEKPDDFIHQMRLFLGLTP